jgi:hypothetical protein
VELLDAEELQANQLLIEYDTKYAYTDNKERKCYNFDDLPKTGKLIQLVFLGGNGIPFCTIRSQKGYMGLDKYSYYVDKIGQEFEIVIQEDRDAEKKDIQKNQA